MMVPGLGAATTLSLAAVCGWAMFKRRPVIVFLTGAVAVALLIILTH